MPFFKRHLPSNGYFEFFCLFLLDLTKLGTEQQRHGTQVYLSKRLEFTKL